MGDIIGRKIMICLTAVIGLLLLITTLLCSYGIKTQQKNLDINTLRSDAGAIAAEIERMKEYKYDSYISYAVILNNGSIAYNNGTSLHGHINMHSIGSANTEFFTMPLLEDGVQFSTLYVDIPQNYYGGNKLIIFLWSILAILTTVIVFSLYIIILQTLKNDIFNPIRQLHASTKDILNGRLENPVIYDYDGEIGMLCHDFELMRSELKDSFSREQKLKEDEKLLMASISHDLKTPLATVHGYLESICLGVVTDNEDIKRYCHNALDKTILLGNMTNDILEHSKAEMHQLSMEFEEVYTAKYFGKLCDTLKADASSRGFTLTYGMIPNLIISLDTTRIAQVMENLVGNSFKYGKKDGNIEISFHEKDDNFFITVKDDGQGIAAQDLPFVFDKFFRGDKARTQSIAGSGLGLSIAKYIIEQHGGKIECDSILSHGTIIEFYLSCNTPTTSIQNID